MRSPGRLALRETRLTYVVEYWAALLRGSFVPSGRRPTGSGRCSRRRAARRRRTRTGRPSAGRRARRPARRGAWEQWRRAPRAPRRWRRARAGRRAGPPGRAGAEGPRGQGRAGTRTSLPSACGVSCRVRAGVPGRVLRLHPEAGAGARAGGGSSAPAPEVSGAPVLVGGQDSAVRPGACDAPNSLSGRHLGHRRARRGAVPRSGDQAERSAGRSALQPGAGAQARLPEVGPRAVGPAGGDARPLTCVRPPAPRQLPRAWEDRA